MVVDFDVLTVSKNQLEVGNLITSILYAEHIPIGFLDVLYFNLLGLVYYLIDVGFY